MILDEALQRPEFQSIDGDATLALFQAIITVPNPDQSLWHWNGVIGALGIGATTNPDQNGIGANGLSVADVSTARDTLSQMTRGYLTLDGLLTTGCQITSPLFLGTLQAMEIKEPPEAIPILNAILALGGPTVGPAWQLTYSMGAEPTLNEIKIAREAIRQRNIIGKFMNEVLNPFFADPNRTVDDLKTLVNNLSS